MDSKKELTFTLYGEPLEELTEDDMWARKPTPIEEQIATDKQGRRRFHGAFTGGFSAGYFNTVGSEEGWKPSTFQSSRAEKASKVQQRAEDFMDDEDQEVFGIAPKVLRARQEYKKAGSSMSSAPTGLLDSILKPVRDTVGVVLLKSMGWRQGQGIGPRQTANEKQQRRKLVKSQRVYGCAMGPTQQEDEESEDDEESENRNILFAPDDLPTFPVAPKTNSFGMGYTGLDKNSQLLSSTGHFSLFEAPDSLMNSKNTGIGIKGQAFGVGAFEKEDDDIYTTDDVNRYDFFLESTSESKKRRLKEKHEMQKKKKQSAECLENFTPATLPLSTVSFYPAPQIPKHFVPKHGARQTRFSEQHPDIAKKLSQPRGRHDLSANERGLLVGEKATQSIQREITLAAKPMPILDFEVVPTEFKPGQFNPFVNNPLKLMRYKQYLTLKKMKQSEKIICLQPAEMTEWEKRRERNEFEQASVLYQPLADMISDRFVSSSVLVGHKETPLDKEPELLQASVKAAKEKLFGKMTRTTQVWHPCALLCKRFNVPEPHSGLAQSITKKKPNFSVFDFLAAKKPKIDDDAVEKKKQDVAKKPVDEPTTSTTAAPSAAQAAPSAPLPVPVAVQPELPPIKPTEMFTTEKMSSEEKMDLFKMVFLSSSEDENEDNEPPVREPTPPPQRRKSPPRGVFKTLDLLAPRTEVQVPEPAPPKPPEKVPEPSINLYGPALPPMALVASPAAGVSLTSTPVAPLTVVKNAEWVEKTKKHKRSRSREHSHKKRKHSKDEKKDKHYSSDDSYKKDKKKKHKKKHKR